MRQLVGSRVKTALSTPAASRTRRSPRAKRTLTRFHPVDYDRGRGIDVQRPSGSDRGACAPADAQ